MNKKIILGVFLGISVFATGCSVFETYPGDYVRMNERMDLKQRSGQLGGQFGNQSNSNLNAQRAVNY